MMNKGSSFLSFEPIFMDENVKRGFSGSGISLPMKLQREEVRGVERSSQGLEWLVADFDSFFIKFVLQSETGTNCQVAILPTIFYCAYE